MSQSVAERPSSVTVAVTVGWLAVILDVVAGATLFALAGNESVLDALDSTESTVRALGIGTLISGAILAIVVFTLGRGSNVSRLLVSIVMAARIGIYVWAIIAIGSHALTEAIVGMAMAITVLALLWNDKANAYFSN
jgi:hypothetical protein